MRKRGMPHMKEGGVNVTPLIDVVMVLIIFFMLVAKIGVTTGAAADITPPESFLGSKIEDMGNTLTLNVRDPRPAEDSPGPNGTTVRVRTGPRPDSPMVTCLVESGSTEVKPVPIREGGRAPLEELLKRVVAHNPNLRIIILAENDLEYRLLEQVLVSCTNAKVKDFNFQMRKRQIPIGQLTE